MRKLQVVKHLLSCVCVCVFVCVFVCVMPVASAATQAKGWRGIVPLHSTRANVERLLGKPRAAGNMYELRTERAYVIYADGGACGKGSESEWNVPRDTVLSIVVTPKVKLRFSALKLDLKRYKRVTDAEVPTHVYYKDEAQGRTYEVFEGGGTENGLILHIQYQPASKENRLRCQRSA
jgi:hypothetical protein